MTLRLREMTSDEQAAINRLTRSRTASAREVERARIIEMAGSGERVPAIAARLEVAAKTVWTWLKQFNVGGVDGLHDSCGASGVNARASHPHRVRTFLSS